MDQLDAWESSAEAFAALSNGGDNEARQPSVDAHDFDDDLDEELGNEFDEDADDEDPDEGADEGADEDADDELPLDDGVAERESVVSCPYCGESVEVTLDPGSGSQQSYIEDCSVCCRPWNVTVTYHEDGSADVWVDASDDQ